MNILITGASGFIGVHLCKALLRRGHYVCGLSHTGRTGNIKPLLQHDKFNLVIGDIRNLDLLCSAIKNNHIKTVFHLAAQLPISDGINNPFEYFETNEKGSLNVLNAAYRYGVETFIYASSMSVYSEPSQYLPVDEKHPVRPTTVYGVTKLAGELHCNPYSTVMTTIVLRYSGAYGTGERSNNAIPTFIRQALDNKPLTVFGDGTQTSDFVYIDDVIHGTLQAWDNYISGVYNIGSSEETSVIELAKRIIDLTNSKSEIVFTNTDTERPFRFVMDIGKTQAAFRYNPRKLNSGLCIYLKEFNISV